MLKLKSVQHHLHHPHRQNPRFHLQTKQIHFDYSPKFVTNAKILHHYKPPQLHTEAVRASSLTGNTALMEADEISFKQTFPIIRTQMVEGNISVRLDRAKSDDKWTLMVGCNLPGKWILHWGVNSVSDDRSEWDQLPPEMRPPGSICIEDYAVETPLKKISSSRDEKQLHQVEIDLRRDYPIAAINFVLKDEETGMWYHHKGRDFKVSLLQKVHENSDADGANRGFSKWRGSLNRVSSAFIKAEGYGTKAQKKNGKSREPKKHIKRLEGFYEDCPILKEVPVQNVLTASVTETQEKHLVHLETDIPGDIVVHWGVCKDNSKNWEISATPHPPNTKILENNALQTLLKKKKDGYGSWGSFSLEKQLKGLCFVLKLNDNTWVSHMGNDFYIPLSTENGTDVEECKARLAMEFMENAESKESVAYTDGILNDIKDLVRGISSEKNRKIKTKGAHARILHEIEKLAAAAYSMFRSSSVTSMEDAVQDSETSKPPTTPTSGTGSGYEILCQGFNWESHKSGRWYLELDEKATKFSSLGFTIIWLPPPTESISPEGYMSRDLYNLNSRYYY